MPMIGSLSVRAWIALVVAVSSVEAGSPPATRPATEEELRLAQAQREAMLDHAPDRVPQGPAWTRSLDLQFIPEVLDFGHMTAGVAKTEVVRLVNVGAEPLTVLKVIPGGSGNTPPWPKDPIPPNHVGFTEITLKPPEKPGITLRKKITFQLEGTLPRVLDLVGYVEEYVRVAPDFIEAPSTRDIEAWEHAATLHHSFALVALDGVPFHVRGIEGATTILPDRAAWMHTIVLGDLADPRASEQVIAISTDHPRSSMVAVVLLD
ncbi:MAG: DUF1573 domain-containing protein [Phycisphaerales bacterium]